MPTDPGSADPDAPAPSLADTDHSVRLARFDPSFDPHQMPIVVPGETLPAVPAARLAPEALRRRFAQPPPWRPEQTDDRFRFGHADPRAAAVLVPIVDHPAGTTVLLTQRTFNLRDHSGQVAFPGGRIEPGDASPTAAALREAREEVGLAASAIEVIGQLPEYLTGTGFRVTPVVGLVTPGFVVRPDPGEVALVFEVPLAFLMDPHHHQRRRVLSDPAGRTFFAMPYRPPGAPAEHFIWGATAAMLRNLYRLLIA